MKIGDNVAVIDEDIQGVVSQIEGNQITFQSDLGFEFTYPSDKLVVLRSQLETDLEQRKFIPQNKDKSTQRKKQQDIKTPVFDLHIEKLQVKHRHLPSSQILDIQLREVSRIINKMKRKHYKDFILVHGQGKGVLRQEIIKILKKHRLPYSDADYLKYGGGALWVQNV